MAYSYQVTQRGQALTIRGTFFNAADQPFSPEIVQLLVTSPDGFTQGYTNTGTIIGTVSPQSSVWEATIIATQSGYYRWQFSGSTAGTIGDHSSFDGRIFVRHGDGTI